jgi:hypothetical protein
MVQPVDLIALNDPAETFAKWQQVGNLRKESKLKDIAMQELQKKQAQQEQFANLYRNGQRPTEDQAYNIAPEYGQQVEQQNAADPKKVQYAKQIASVIKQQALSSGFNPQDPNTQPILEKISAPYRPILAKTFGVQDDPSKPMSWQHLDALAGLTPQEQAQQEIKNKVAERQALMPLDLQAKQAEYGMRNEADLSKEGRQFDRQKELENSKFQNQIQLEDYKSKQPKPINEVQQYKMDELKSKKEADFNDAVSNIDNTIDEFKNLKTIQARTTTGPVSASPMIAGIRKALPNNVSGGEDLQRLEQGYNTMAVKAIAAFKAGGVTFGQLSNAEGKWIKDTTAELTKTGTVNQEILDHGLKLLEERKARIAKQAGTETKESYSTLEDLQNAFKQGKMSKSDAIDMAKQKGFVR